MHAQREQDLSHDPSSGPGDDPVPADEARGLLLLAPAEQERPTVNPALDDLGRSAGTREESALFAPAEDPMARTLHLASDAVFAAGWWDMADSEAVAVWPEPGKLVPPPDPRLTLPIGETRPEREAGSDSAADARTGPSWEEQPIRERAYLLAEAAGFPKDRANDFWLQAEKEIRCAPIHPPIP